MDKTGEELREWIEFSDPEGFHARPATRLTGALVGIFPATEFGVVGENGGLVKIGESGPNRRVSWLRFIEETYLALSGRRGAEFWARGPRAEDVLALIREIAGAEDPGAHEDAGRDTFRLAVDAYTDSLLRMWRR